MNVGPCDDRSLPVKANGVISTTAYPALTFVLTRYGQGKPVGIRPWVSLEVTVNAGTVMTVVYNHLPTLHCFVYYV